jgi:hypothetical protein
MEIGRVAYPGVAPSWAPLACLRGGRHLQRQGPGQAWSDRGDPRSPSRPAAGDTSPRCVRLQPSTTLLPLMRPAPNPCGLAVGRPRAGRGPCTPAAVHRPDNAPHAPHPRPHPRAACPVVQAPRPAQGPPAAGTAPALPLGWRHTGPNSAPARPWLAAHGAASVQGTAPGVSASSAVSPGPRGLCSALHTGRPPAGHHRSAHAPWRSGPPAGSGPRR